MTDMIFNAMIGCIEYCSTARTQAKAKRTALASLRVPCVFWTCC